MLWYHQSLVNFDITDFTAKEHSSARICLFVCFVEQFMSRILILYQHFLEVIDHLTPQKVSLAEVCANSDNVTKDFTKREQRNDKNNFFL